MPCDPDHTNPSCKTPINTTGPAAPEKSTDPAVKATFDAQGPIFDAALAAHMTPHP
jgi:hypothetical protein